MKKKNKKNYTANFENLVDLVDHDGKVKFLVLDDGELERGEIKERDSLKPRS